MSLSDHVRIAAELRERLALDQEDEETRHDIIEGATDLLEILAKIARSAREAEAFGDALQAMQKDMAARRARYETRAAHLRSVILWAMQEAGITKHEAPDLTMSVGKSGRSVIVTNATVLPKNLVEFTVTPDKAAIKARLNSGDEVPGAMLSNSAPSLTIRSK